MNFSSEAPFGEAKLALHLENRNGSSFAVQFLGIVTMSAVDFNQYTQVWLTVTDISTDQLDRIAYSVKDSENGRLELMCRKIEWTNASL